MGTLFLKIMRMKSVILTFLIRTYVGYVTVDADHDWMYNNQGRWPGYCNSGKAQSPIALSNKIAIRADIPKFKFNNYEKPYKAVIKNTGHTVDVRLVNGPTPSVINGGLLDEYVFDSFHFHWSSEHTINDYRYPLEVHFVHHAKKYGNLSNALQYEDGLAVIAALYMISSHKNKAFHNLTKSMNEIAKNVGKSVELKNDLILKYLLPTNTEEFYRYRGSLTTPNCNEIVTWTVFKQPTIVSRLQIKRLSSIWASDNVAVRRNYRNLQELNGRIVLISGHREKSSTDERLISPDNR